MLMTNLKTLLLSDGCKSYALISCITQTRSLEVLRAHASPTSIIAMYFFVQVRADSGLFNLHREASNHNTSCSTGHKIRIPFWKH